MQQVFNQIEFPIIDQQGVNGKIIKLGDTIWVKFI